MRQWLREKRESAGFTQQQLADKLAKNITTIGKYENGTRTPKTKTAKKIASILDFDWTLFFEDEKNAS